MAEVISPEKSAGSRGDLSLSLLLPDKSVAVLDRETLQFRSVERTVVKGLDEPPPVPIRLGKLDPKEINFNELANAFQHPEIRFGDCFRRVSDQPRYSAKFDVRFLTRLYEFPGSYSGGPFSSIDTQWRFLDGGIIRHIGYGWGSHTWTVVEGVEALRTVRMFFGIRQPRTIKGEQSRRPLSVLLEEMTREPCR